MTAVTLLALLGGGVLAPAPAPRLGEPVHITTPTRGPVVALLAPVTVTSRVEGDVVVLGADVVITDGGVVDGDVVAVAGTVHAAGEVRGRAVAASTRGVLAPFSADSRRSWRSVWGAHLVHFGAWLLVVGAIAVGLPQPARRGSEVLRQRPGRALGVGVLALLVWVAVAGIGLLLGVSPAGAGVVMAATTVLVAFKVLGVVVVAYTVGWRLLPVLPVALRAEAPRTGVGMLVILLAALLPLAGEALWLAANVAGIGAVIVIAAAGGRRAARQQWALRRAQV